VKIKLAIFGDCAILSSVSERKNNMKNEMKKTVKVMGPWIDGVRTVKEISLDEWNSYTPLNRRVKGEWFKVVKW
jgi:hypothetical protein